MAMSFEPGTGCQQNEDEGLVGVATLGLLCVESQLPERRDSSRQGKAVGVGRQFVPVAVPQRSQQPQARNQVFHKSRTLSLLLGRSRRP